LSAARLWKSYRRRLGEDRRVRWATAGVVATILAAAWFAPWLLFIMGFFVLATVAVFRTGLFDELLVGNEDFDEWS
jgi:hypothetical protein